MTTLHTLTHSSAALAAGRYPQRLPALLRLLPGVERVIVLMNTLLVLSSDHGRFIPE